MNWIWLIVAGIAVLGLVIFIVRRNINDKIELEEKIKVIKLAQHLSGSDQNTRDIKLKINEYIREIDKCLGLINR